jgi:hypothetical protein
MIKLTPAIISEVTNNPLTLCFKLLGMSLGKVKKAPKAMVKPIWKLPKYENNNTGETAVMVIFKALVKSVPAINF